MGATSNIDLQRISSEVVRAAAAVVRKGGILLYPTDTIYGLGCDAYNAQAVDRLFAIKRRPEKNRALILASGSKMLEELVTEIPESARRLMERFWPGPLTIIFRSKTDLHPSITGDDRKVGVRIPDNRFCLKLVKACGVPVVSTSANVSGRNYAGDPVILRKIFLKEIDFMVDAGDLRGALPSTVVDATEEPPLILRTGRVPDAAIEKVLRETAQAR
ncbi:MAG TPA: L-threonylcarbamoyladenylate synthase [Bacteroidota bacterium]|nr:L-threonylcarbamoyladenylate synthase [Bacteroidota bacterium]